MSALPVAARAHLLRRRRGRAGRLGLEVRGGPVRDPRSAQAVLRVSAAELLVVGSRGRGAPRPVVLGSGGRALLQRAPVPVLWSPPRWPGEKDCSSTGFTVREMWYLTRRQRRAPWRGRADPRAMTRHPRGA